MELLFFTFNSKPFLSLTHSCPYKNTLNTTSIYTTQTPYLHKIMANEIWVVPFFGQGHLFPCMELCKHLASRNFQTTLVISSNLASSLPSSLLQHPLIRMAGISPAPEPGFHPPPAHENLAPGLEKLLLSPGPENQNPSRPVCAIVDIMMSWSGDVFKKFGVPTAALFTSGACSAAVEHATWRARPLDVKPGETRFLPELPDTMAVTHFDLKLLPHAPPQHGGGAGFPHPPGPPGPRKMGPPGPGGEPRWVEEVRESTALLINTCQDLERPFIEYIANETGKPVWAVGPLLPEQYWNPSGSFLRDREVRSKRKSSVTEDEVIQWLDSKPRGSVLYVSFGTEVGPNMEEYVQLGEALESSGQPFILVLQPGSGKQGPPRAFLGLGQGSSGPETEEGYSGDDLEGRVGDRGLIIRGWAPQLLILSHPSTGGFLSHCGWNSTVEAVGRGVPLLAWPLGGDQFFNAKLVVAHLKVAYMVCDDASGMVKKDDVVKGIERLMSDKKMKNRAEILSENFQNGFPGSSNAGLDAFKDYISKT